MQMLLPESLQKEISDIDQLTRKCKFCFPLIFQSLIAQCLAIVRDSLKLLPFLLCIILRRQRERGELQAAKEAAKGARSQLVFAFHSQVLVRFCCSCWYQSLDVTQEHLITCGHITHVENWSNVVSTHLHFTRMILHFKITKEECNSKAEKCSLSQ